MLAPAIKYKDKLEELFTYVIYSEDYMYYHGYAHEHELPKIGLEYGAYQYAIIDNDEIVGFLAYRIDTSTDSVFNFGLISFQKGNLTVVSDTLHQFKKLVRDHNRVEWRCVGGNPASKLYDKICKKYGGIRMTLHQAGTDLKGNIVDSYIYEILKDRACTMEQSDACEYNPSDKTSGDIDLISRSLVLDTIKAYKPDACNAEQRFGDLRNYIYHLPVYRNGVLQDNIQGDKITNADRIRKMTNVELGDFLYDIIDHCHTGECKDCPMSLGKSTACNAWIWLGRG